MPAPLALRLAGAGALAGLARALASAVSARRYTFHGKTVLVTGASRGLGLVLARQLVAQKAKVAICARDLEELEGARDDLAAIGEPVLALVCDVTDRAEVERVVHTVEERFGPVEVLIHNAGIIQVGPVEEMTLEDFEHAMAVHFWGALYTSRAVIPGMRRRGRGRIVHISSIGGKVPVPHLLPYTASKHALTGFSEGLRAELLPAGIRVTTVCPGLMRTGSSLRASFKGRHRAEHGWFALAGNAPLLSVNAERAARKILKACRRGQAVLTLSPQAKLLASLHGLFPGLTARAMSWVNRALPKAGGIGKRAMEGRESHTVLTQGLLTSLGRRAALRNREV
jgi:NAD(P)-dependent dehydrogenase (short-subunit alcohol dehydrogenase family)